LDQIDLSYLATKAGIKDPHSINSFLDWWIRAGEKIQNISNQEFHRKLKKELKDIERIPDGIKNVLVTDSSRLKTVTFKTNKQTKFEN
jgi:predicted nucleotide-binding protein (sugar kinase/HSP70/actin superfamily)